MHRLARFHNVSVMLLAVAAATGVSLGVEDTPLIGVDADETLASKEWVGNVSISLSAKKMSGADWGISEDQTEFGIEGTWGKKHWPLQIATDFLVSDDEQTETLETDTFTTVTVREALASTSEIALGVRKVWSTDRFQFNLGGGIAFILAELDGAAIGLEPDRMEEDIGTGWWVGGGAFWRIGRYWGLGLTARRSTAAVDLFGEKRDAGGVHWGFTLGWSWPAASSAAGGAGDPLGVRVRI